MLKDEGSFADPLGIFNPHSEAGSEVVLTEEVLVALNLLLRRPHLFRDWI